MANTILTTEAFRKSIDTIFDEVYSEHSKRYNSIEPYILEQCGKQYRVKDCYARPTEYKTGWLKLKEAQAIMKLLKGNEND